MHRRPFGSTCQSDDINSFGKQTSPITAAFSLEEGWAAKSPQMRTTAPNDLNFLMISKKQISINFLCFVSISNHYVKGTVIMQAT